MSRMETARIPMIPSPEELKRIHTLLRILHDRMDCSDVYRVQEQVCIFDQGGGDHAVFVQGPLPFVRAFDHESPVSPHAREDGSPHPDLTKGVPESVVAFHTERFPADERTWLAWWEHDHWVTRGDENYPADALWPDADQLLESVEASGFILDPNDARGLLDGSITAEAVTLTPIPKAHVDLPGWTEGCTIQVEVRAATPVSGIAALKAMRAATGASFAVLKAALQEQTPLANVRAGPFEFDAARTLGAIRQGLKPHAEVEFRAGVDPNALHPISLQALRVALGVSASYLG